MVHGAGGWEVDWSRRQEEKRDKQAELKGRPGRRTQLQNFARRKFALSNRCQILVNVVAKAAELVEPVPASLRTSAMIDDLEAVMIGTNMRGGRGSGPHFAGNISGADGFKSDLKDQWNQTQHAIAGLVIGYRHGKLGEWYARWRESEEQDDRLYIATCPIGRSLFWWPNEYKDVAEKLRQAVCDSSCKVPSSKG